VKDYHINIFYGEDDEGYVADIPDLAACSAFGETPEQALAEVLSAKASWLSAAKEKGKPIPSPAYRPAIYQVAQQYAWARFLWFDERPVPETGFGSLDESLWKPLLSVQDAADPELALNRMGLLTDTKNSTRRATVAGVLLCCHDPETWLPNACITATRYRGTDRASEQIEAREITGPLNRQIAEAVAFAVRNMQVAAYKDPARTDLPQYSERAIFEAVVNAVAHRDYSIRDSRIRLSQFSDRLEIQSPGALPNSLAIENIAERQATRNEVLVSMLERMLTGDIPGSGKRRYFMGRRGDGVPIIRSETLGASGRDAEFRIVKGKKVLVVLPSAPIEPSPALVEHRTSPENMPA